MKTEEAFSQFIAGLRNRGLSPKTLEFYQWGVSKFVRHCPELPTDASEIAAVYDDPALGRKSRERLECAIRIFLGWAEKTIGHPNPLEGVPKRLRVKTLPRVLTVGELDMLWQACANNTEKALIALLLDTGIRLGEVVNLRHQDLRSDTLTVTGKSGPRVVPVSPPVREMLEELGDGEHIWVSRHGPMSRVAVQNAIRRIFDRAGIKGPKIGPHVIRHSFATHYIANGGNLYCLQQILGHASITTTELYLHLSAAMTRADHEVHSPAAKMLEGLPSSP